MAFPSIRFVPRWQKSKFSLPITASNDLYSVVYCHERCGHSAVCVRDDLIIWGGYHEISNSSSSYADDGVIWTYNVDLDIWWKIKTIGDNPKSRSGAASALLWPWWYIIAGHSYYGDTSDVYRLHLTELEWEKVTVSGPSISARDKSSAWAWENRIYVFGGYGNTPTGLNVWDPVKDAHCLEFGAERGWNDQLIYFDTETNQWIAPTVKGSKPNARAAHATVCDNDIVYLFGGRHCSQRLNDFYSLHLPSHTWKSIQCLGALPQGRSWHSLSKCNSNMLLLFGGFSNQDEPLDDAWSLNTETLSWTLLKVPQQFPRLWHSASVTSSGDVLVFGGCTNNILDTSVVMDTSDKIILFRLQPFRLERMCLHAVYKHKDLLRDSWGDLTKQLQDWLRGKYVTSKKFSAIKYRHNLELGCGPTLSHLAFYTKADAQRLNEKRRKERSYYFF